MGLIRSCDSRDLVRGAMDLTLGFVLLVALGIAGAQYPFRNTSLPFDARVKASMSVHASSLPQRENIEKRGAEMCRRRLTHPILLPTYLQLSLT